MSLCEDHGLFLPLCSLLLLQLWLHSSSDGGGGAPAS
jgi:hypothetical protein